MTTALEHKRWYEYLTPEAKSLARVSFTLLESDLPTETTADHSFIVFSLSKAYEGFLKQFLHELGLISKDTYKDRYFRIGRALNPDVRKNQRDRYWLYDDVARRCGKETARNLWEAWLQSRNQLFHYFPSKLKIISKAEAQEKVMLLVSAMDDAVSCL